jgi:phytoene dehydrogenase-like protein
LCSAIHPLALISPFFRTLPLAAYGLEWIQPTAALAHPLDDGPAALVKRSVEATAATLGADAGAYQRLMNRLAADWEGLAPALLGPPRFPRHPVALARFGFWALRSASGLIKKIFRQERARALFAGLSAHSMLPLEQTASAAFGLVLGVTAHVAGWPIPRGGAQRIADALASYLRSLGGEIVTHAAVGSIDELPPARTVICDVTPRQLLAIAGHRLSPGFRRRMLQYRYGPGAYKIDWALKGPIPWKAAECREAGTVHLGGSFEEIAASESTVWHDEHSERPFVLVAQPSLFDPSRAPEGMHIAWAYCHVPHASRFDMTERIEDQLERFAPGFRDRVLARHVATPSWLEQHNANLVGGDINGGVQDLRQMFLRPTRRLYSTTAKGLYICSASTPPGGGVHGMCGYFAARRALRDSS